MLPSVTCTTSPTLTFVPSNETLTASVVAAPCSALLIKPSLLASVVISTVGDTPPFGTPVSIVNGTSVVTVFGLPGTVSATLITCGPSGIGVVGVTDQVPSVPTVVVNVSLGVTTVIVAPGLPVPIIVGVLSLVILSELELPVSEFGSSLAVNVSGCRLRPSSLPRLSKSTRILSRPMP